MPQNSNFQNSYSSYINYGLLFDLNIKMTVWVFHLNNKMSGIANNILSIPLKVLKLNRVSPRNKLFEFNSQCEFMISMIIDRFLQRRMLSGCGNGCNVIGGGVLACDGKVNN